MKSPECKSENIVFAKLSCTSCSNSTFYWGQRELLLSNTSQDRVQIAAI